MKETARLLKAIVFVVLTFVFAFLLLTGKYPLLSQKDKKENIITDNSKPNNQSESIINNGEKPSASNSSINKTEDAEFTGIKNDIKGSWQVTEISSGGRTAKIDLTKKLTPEETMIYTFKDDRIDVYWKNTQSVLTYRWINKDTIETIQPATSIDKEDYKERAAVSIKGDKLYMSAVDADNNKSTGVLVRFKGELPKVTSR